MRSVSRGFAKLFLVVLGVTVVLTPLLSGGGEPGQPAFAGQPASEKPHPKLESSLSQLLTAWQQGRLTPFSTQRAIEVLPEEKVRVVIESEPGKIEEVASLAASLGCQVEISYGNLIQALAPISSLIELGNSPAVKRVRLPFAFAPSVVSEGVEVIGADVWQAQGFTGTGVKVGVLDGGFSGYDGLLGTELPDTVTVWWAPSIGGPGSSVHGTACAEIVYDVSPNAEFYLANFNTEVEWANAIDWLISQGVDVISCSMGWLNTGPGDGTGVICAKVTDARAAGILWSQSAGNQARRHWSGYWSDPDGNGWLNFTSTDETNMIYASAGDQITVGLRWDDPWGASGNDYDLYLLDDSQTIVASSTNWQDGNDNPTETLVYTVSTSGYYHIKVEMYSADGTARFDLFTFDHDLQYQVAAGSLLEPADSPDAMTMGAVPWDNPDTLEYFSSQGPTTDGRTKPDLVAPDGVSNVTYGTFYGTSAAAPHGAGAAVLVKQRYPVYTPDQIQGYLEGNAVDLGTAGKDNQYGSGRLLLPAGTAAIFRVEREPE